MSLLVLMHSHLYMLFLVLCLSVDCVYSELYWYVLTLGFCQLLLLVGRCVWICQREHFLLVVYGMYEYTVGFCILCININRGNYKKESPKGGWNHTLKKSWVPTGPPDPPVVMVAVAAVENPFI